MGKSGEVEDYYDRNTSWFLRFGRGGDVGTIHRELWAPGVVDLHGALVQANVLVEEALPTGAARLVDLGCGVGGTLCWLLARDANRQGVGLTISAEQVGLARRRAARAGLAERATFAQGDFIDPPELGHFDVAYSIEAFVHSPNPQAYLQAAARLVRPGGRLVVIDDMLSATLPAEAHPIVQRFVQGWRATSLCSVATLTQRAHQEGLELVEDRDLTPWVPVFRWRERWIGWWVTGLSWAPIRHPYWGSLVGGHALQTCLSRGWVTYRRLVFRRVDHSDSE